MRKIMVGVAASIGAAILATAGFAIPATTLSGAPDRPSGEPQDEVLARFTAPTDLAFLPDGRALITSQHGQVWLFQPEDDTVQTVLDLSAEVCDNYERGMLGIAVDPVFDVNRHIYLYYTFRNGASECKDARQPVNRVSRFTMGADDVIDPASARVLIDRIPSPTGVHNGGALAFDARGLLYVGVGETGQWDDRAQRLNTLSGKILRITRDGGIPRGNPLVKDPTSVRCGNPAEIELGEGPCQEIFAWGLRNPFRIAFMPNRRGFFINDIGSDTWEEIDPGKAGANYGWPLREGGCEQDSVEECGPSSFDDPLYTYAHRDGCDAITAGAFEPKTGAYLFADFGCGRIFMVPYPTSAHPTSTAVLSGELQIVSMGFSPVEPDALYALTFGSGEDNRGALHLLSPFER